MTEETLFELALNAPAADRAALLDRECAGDPTLRTRVEALLAAHEHLEAASRQEPGPPTAPATSADGDATALPMTAEPPPTPDARPVEGVGSTLAGKYKLLEEIGEGGMGSVFLAQQTAPVRRAVAVKVIKAGMDSRAVLARFDAERQALALMDHPNIARVLDAGATESGRPFFVMELVKGTPMTEFCDERRLTPRQRLELFVPVCQAIQHAHQKGVIHRDIKPSNVLIALYDDRPVPKVIDFGVAKATESPLTDHSLVTGLGAVVGTPEYMSPEQATLNNHDVDTRSDIYALGVLLYELLTGTTPVDRKSLGRAAVLEVLRVVREVEPPRPSTRLSTLEALPSIAARRNTEPARLAALLRGELDWIAMKALEKDRSRRYETANALARDVQRYLADEVVEARPPSAGYRVRKFARRHKGRVIAASLVLLALVAGVIGTSWGLVRAERALRAEARRAEGERQARQQAQRDRDKAIQAEQAERTAREHEQEQRKYAQAIADFVRNDFLALTSVEGQYRFGSGPEDAGLNRDTTLRQLLDRAAGKLAQRRDLDPRTEAELNWIVGVNYRALGEASRSVPYLERCVALRRQMLGRDDQSTLSAQNSLGVAYNAAGRWNEALPLYDETLRQMKAKLGPDHPHTLVAMVNLARSYQAARKLDSALPLFEEALRLMKAKRGPDHPDTLATMGSLAAAYRDARKPDMALPLFEKSLRLMKARLGPDHPETLTTMNNRALGYMEAGKLDLALPLLEDTLRLRKAKLGPDHPDTLTTMNNLALGYMEAGKLDLALPLSEETLRQMKTKLGLEHPHTLTAMGNLARGYRAAGKLDSALPLYQDTLRLMKARFGPDHHDTLITMMNLAQVYRAAGKLDSALPLFEEALRLMKAKLGPDHPDTLATMSSLAAGYQDAGKLDLALPLLEDTLRLSQAKLGPDHPDTITAMNNLAGVYRDVGKFDRALPLLEETLRLWKAKLGPDHPETLTSMNNLAAGYWSAHRLDRSVPLFEEAIKRRESKLGRTHPDTLLTVANLGVNYRDAGRLDEALPLLEEAYRASQRFSTLRWVRTPLLDAYAKAGRSAQAAALVKELLADARKSLPQDSPQLAQMLAQNGLTLLQSRAFAEAESPLRECLAIRAKAEPEGWRTFNTQAMLGGALLGQKKYAEAEPMLRQGYEGMKARAKSIPWQGAARLPEALDRLIELYTATNRPDEVQKWRAERARYDKDAGSKPAEKK
jgi:serine/threonine protein kinase/tetratricopeptide (TPR) repeat protein